MENRGRPESFIVPARRSQWLVSALAYAFGFDQGIENEVVVLATGIDQYIQEIFHHLDVLGKDRVSRSDFKLLCEVIGFQDCGASPPDEEPEVAGTTEDPDGELTFKEFHSRLVHCFIGEDGSDRLDGGCMERRWDNNGKFVEAEVRVLPRSGLSVRTMCTECFQQRPVTEIYHSVLFKQGQFHYTDGSSTAETGAPRRNGVAAEDVRRSVTASETSECHCEAKLKSESARLQQENDGLREIIEDMRQALQSSDARHLALLVSLRKLQAAALDGSNANRQPFPPLPPKLPGHSSIRPQNAVTLARELSRLRDDRERQLEEAICYTQSLEADLWRSKRSKNQLEQARSVLLGKQQTLTQRLCSARQTLSGGLDRVRELEKQVEEIEDARAKLKQAAGWKQRDSEEETDAGSDHPATTCSEGSGGKAEGSGQEASEDSGGSLEDSGGTSEDSGGDHLTGMDSGCVSDSDRGSPTSAGSETDSSSLGSGSVSDEESAWQEEANNNNNNNTNNNNNSCANSALTGGLNKADWLIKLTQVQKHLLQTEVEKGQAEGKFKQVRADLLHELNAKLKENEEYQTEIQSLETERVRLSVIESTVGEVIMLLRKLRNLNLSRRSAGKILMDTLEVCLQDNYRSDSENEVRNFLNFLHKQLMHHDLLRLSGVRGTQSTPSSPVMMRRSAAAAAPGRSLRLSTDFYQFDGCKPKKVCRGGEGSSEEVEDMACNGNGDSPTLDV